MVCSKSVYALFLDYVNKNVHKKCEMEAATRTGGLEVIHRQRLGVLGPLWYKG